MSARAGQLFVCGFDGTKVNDHIAYLIREKHIAGVILFRRNIVSREQLKALTNELQQEAKKAGYQQPLLICIDEECGTVSRLSGLITPFPGAMLLAAANDEMLVEQVYRALAKELRALGINWNLAPVVDVQNNRDNPVIGVRSFGEHAKQVGKLGVRALKGLQQQGVVATLKHFPGHGDTAVDSHLSLPVIDHDEHRLQEVELVPFKYGIEANVDCIMAAHIHFPQLDDEKLPASISSNVINGLLREQLKYDGAVITDCLEMHAIIDSIGIERGSVKAVQAGIDFLLVSHTFSKQLEAIEAVEQAISNDEITTQQLEQALARIAKVAARVEQPLVGEFNNQVIAKQAFEQGVTVIREQLIKFGKVVPILLLGEHKTIAEDAVSLQTFVNNALGSQAVQWLTFEESTKLHEPFIIVTQNAADSAQYVEQLRYLQQVNAQFAVIAAKKPYDAALTTRMTVCTYEPSVEALTVAFAILLHGQPSFGQLPVSI